MRNKIDYGIDLGTTNSAIARIKDGEPAIIRTDVQKEIMPSCVHFNAAKDTLVGDRAFRTMLSDNVKALKTFSKMGKNTFVEFKRTMGTTTTYECSNMKKSFTSEELSAEVLKKLKSFVLDENITSIVITVPAKFLNPQKEATVRAAKLAGFKQVELLQEPVAAATAYGLTAKDKNSYWLVFDFGGGTFDAALIKSDEGILIVKDTEGDNWLGGKNLDEAIVDQIFIPYLQQNYAINNIMSDTVKKEILRNALKSFAEDVKNQLSFTEKVNMYADDNDLQFQDDNGNNPMINLWIDQQQLTTIFSPVFQKAIDIAKDLLKRNNLKGSDLGALILVGGPTLSPILRRMLKEQITQNVDTSVDPMTVVAKGAALFASTISVSEEVKDSSRDKTKLQLEINYESTSIDTTEYVNIKVLKEKTIGNYPEKIYADIVRGDGAWSSGKKQISEKVILVEVLLQEGCSNAFTVRVYDDQGNQLECQPNQFSILQGIGGLGDLSTLPYYIGIGKWSDVDEKEVFTPAKGLEKNKKLPATGVINGLKTGKTIRPGIADDIIRIPIFQGEYNAEDTNPKLNNLIQEIIITGENLPALLPEDSPVDITIKVDRSEQMLFSANFPTIDYTEEVKVQIKQEEPPTEEFLKKEIAEANNIAQSVNASDIESKVNTIETQLENEKGSSDGKLKLWANLRKELLKLDEILKSNEWPKIEKELKDTFYELENLIEKIKKNGDEDKLKMDKVNAAIMDYRKKIEYTIKEKNRKEAKELTREISRMDFNLRDIVSESAIMVQYIHNINDDFSDFHWKDTSKARLLVNQGMQMAIEGKNSLIRPILVELFNLMPEDEKDRIKGEFLN